MDFIVRCHKGSGEANRCTEQKPDEFKHRNRCEVVSGKKVQGKLCVVTKGTPRRENEIPNQEG